ncbi:MAG: response regulator [Planctomycetota bacterium]
MDSPVYGPVDQPVYRIDTRREPPTAQTMRLSPAHLGATAVAQDRSVLHVDDDPAFCRLVDYQLSRRGYRVTSLTAPTDLPAAVEEVRPTVVVLDVCMDRASGLQVLDQLQRRDRGLQVVMLTGLIGEDTLVNAHAMGALGCVFKPVDDWQTLYDLVDTAASRTRAWQHTLRRARAARQGQTQAT